MAETRLPSRAHQSHSQCVARTAVLPYRAAFGLHWALFGCLRRLLAATTTPKNVVDFEQCALALGLDCLNIGALPPIAPQWRHGQTLVARACPLGTTRAASADDCGCVHWKRSWLRAHVCVGMDTPCVKTKARVCVAHIWLSTHTKDTRRSSQSAIRFRIPPTKYAGSLSRVDHDDDDWNVVGGGCGNV
jgi:hypothetical protein